MTRALLALLLCVSGCAVVPPGPLEAEERWKDLMREGGYIAARGTVYLPPPRLERPAGLDLAEEAPVSFDQREHSWYWPDSLPPEFADELRTILRKNSGYEIELWSGADDADVRARCDYELELVVTTFKLELAKIGLASSLASLWPLGLVHLSSFYNAPDERYRCEYRLRATLRRVGGGWSESAEIVASKELALTDFQRGWTLHSWWPEQKLGWLPTKDAVGAWKEYGPSVVRNVEPHARRALLVDLMGFVRRTDPPSRRGAPPRPFSLIIGVPAARGVEARAELAHEDARAVAERLGSQENGRIQLLLGEEATADEAQRRLWSQVDRVSEGQRVILYFAGCGALEDGRLALHLGDRPCALDLLLEPLRAIRRRGGVPVVILDAGFFGGERCAADAGGEPDAEQVLARLEAELGGIYVWLAGKGSAGAPASAEVGHGVFTQLFLAGLRPGTTLDELARQAPHAALLGPADRSLPLLLAEPQEKR